MMIVYFKRISWLLLLVTFTLSTQVSLATETVPYKEVDGVVIYLGALPAQMILGHGKEHPESKMHGGIPTSTHRYHLLVSLFDNATGQRITDADVTATVEEIGLTSETKTLEPMKIVNTITFGNYFKIDSQNLYRIIIQIRRIGTQQKMIKAEFTQEHFPKYWLDL
ncbi:MAG: hypothetical protein H0U71_09710 [Gammaproteobacteria bacterium]|nr:hypothetical protein [Gammaproteobacteria bacterium]